VDVNFVIKSITTSAGGMSNGPRGCAMAAMTGEKWSRAAVAPTRSKRRFGKGVDLMLKPIYFI
jgi:hypothetical protein